jgi:hypothetical protein
MFVLSFVSKDRKAKCRIIKTKKLVRMKYIQSTREYKKVPPGAGCVLYSKEKRQNARIIKTKKQVWKKYKDRKRKSIKKSRWGRDFPHPSRPALEPTQPPVQWVPGPFSGSKGAEAWRYPDTPI